MTARTITFTLTEAQFRALAGAIADADVGDEGEEMDSYRRGLALARANAWQKVNRAWHEKGRKK